MGSTNESPQGQHFTLHGRYQVGGCGHAHDHLPDALTEAENLVALGADVVRVDQPYWLVAGKNPADDPGDGPTEDGDDTAPGDDSGSDPTTGGSDASGNDQTSGDSSDSSDGGSGDGTPGTVNNGSVSGVAIRTTITPARTGEHVSVQGTLSEGTKTRGIIMPGERLRLQNGSGDPLPISVWHTADGCVSVENWYPETPGDVKFSQFKLTVGASNVLHDGPLKVWAHAGPRPFWYQKPQQLASVDKSLLPKYGTGSENASEYANWQKADNSIYGRGLTDPGMGGTGERDDLGAPLSRWDACFAVNPIKENAKVVRSQGDEAALEPFHLLDPQTNKMLLVQDYPEATFLGVYLGKRGPIADFTTENEQNLSQATAHAPSFGLGGVLAFNTEYDQLTMDMWANYVACLWQNPNYRLSTGVSSPAHNQNRGKGRSLNIYAFAAKASQSHADYFAAMVNEFGPAWATYLNEGCKGIHVDSHMIRYNNTGIAPWEHHIELQAAGYALELGFESMRGVVEYFTPMVFDSLMTEPHELASSYNVKIIRDDGSWAKDWNEVLKLTATVEPKIKAALAAGTDTIALQKALGQAGPSWSAAGLFSGYPYAATGYPAIMQPALAVAVRYAKDQATAKQVWTKFKQHSIIDFSSDPKYNHVP